MPTKTKPMIKHLPIVVCLLCFINVVVAQSTDSTFSRVNTIKLDLTSHVFYRKAFVLSYERVTKPNQSFSISGGYQQFPKILNFGDNIKTTEELKKTGFKFGAEYRFYLKKENKFQAPHGVYIGPYASYLDFTNDKDMTFTAEDGTTSSGTLNSKLSVTNIGVQLGYQFVLNNRWTIDLVFVGPSVSRYSLKMDLNGEFNIDEEEFYQNEIVQKLIEAFPMFDDLIQDKTVSSSGKSSSWAYGYRYQFLVGYHFGRKKK